MKKELEKELVKDFPELFLNLENIQASLMCFGCECADGWYNIIYETLSQIYAIAKVNRLFEGDYPLYLTQIKEKYGSLRIYVSWVTDEIFDILNNAEERSLKICEVCGKKGELRGKMSWIKTLCDKHYKEFK